MSKRKRATPMAHLALGRLGWNQLGQRPAVAPVLHGLDGGAITTVVPSTTATALTSITTGLQPGEHGIVGYRFPVKGEILNTLRWTTPSGDARNRIPPHRTQPVPAFLGGNVPVVTKAEFASSGFSGVFDETSTPPRDSEMAGLPVAESTVVEVTV